MDPILREEEGAQRGSCRGERELRGERRGSGGRSSKRRPLVVFSLCSPVRGAC